MTASISTRLHITPLDAGLLPVVLGPRLLNVAENISFHTLTTFPENNYGYVDLPDTDAKNLISKLNGSILKGKKMKLEKARSKKRSQDILMEDHAPRQESSPKKARTSSNLKEDGLIEGYQLEAGRKVKRGWTEPKQKEASHEKSKDKKEKKNKKDKAKRQVPSQYTGKEELLFQTNLPPNKAHLDKPASATKEKKQKRGTLVHEFQRTDVQPDFIRNTTSAARTAEYVESVGWVDENGTTVEKPPPTMSHLSSIPDNVAKAPASRSSGVRAADKPITSPSTSSGLETDLAASQSPPDAQLLEDPTSSSDLSSSDTDSDSDSDQPIDAQPKIETVTQDDGGDTPQTPLKVHPLEVLFKRPRPATGQEAPKPSLEIETSFAFFDHSADDADDTLPSMPTTPFTSNDLRSREIRSAAPTPDTAHPSRFTSFASELSTRPSRDQNIDDKNRQTAQANPASLRSGEASERVESDFEKRFWVERGQNNRAWKARRKTALKEQRQKENRSRRPKNW